VIGGEVVNADSMQLYRGMDIGTAKATPAERGGVAHHLLDIWDVVETASVADYQARARACVDELLARGRTPVVVGGSGLYVRALIDRIEFPGTDPALRAGLEAELAAGGPQPLHERLASVDPAAAAAILPTNGRRIVRALEVVELTGQPFAASAPTIGEPRWGTTIIALDRDTAELDERIAQRTGQMFSQGFVDEVASLLAQGLREGVTAARAIGYAQVIAALDGEHDIAQAQESTFTGTRRYVRRQRSWFRRDPRVHWLDAATPDLLGQALRAAGR
jgi:tRNA dimethylallyltransferase